MSIGVESNERADMGEVGAGSGGVEVVPALEVEPELGAGSESSGDSEGGVGGD